LRRKSGNRKRLGTLLVVVGVLILLTPLGQFAYSRYQQWAYTRAAAAGGSDLSGNSGVFIDPEPRVQIPHPTTVQKPEAPPPPAGNKDPRIAGVWRLHIPKIGLHTTLMPTTSEADLRKGPGIYPEGSQPGKPGNLCIAGHRNTCGFEFWYLYKVQAGDKIYVSRGTLTYVYEAERNYIIAKNDWGPIAQTDYDAITLTTCWNGTQNRMVVRGKLTAVGDYLPR
jgi:LPXTG-site transpeptidase (sortase) family protein